MVKPLVGSMKKKPVKDQQILEAARDEFLKSGIVNASMKHIAIRANVSKRTLYKYYPSKMVLFDELVSLCLKMIDEKMVFHYEPNLKLRDAIGSVIDLRISLLINKQFVMLVKVMLLGQLKQNSPLPQCLSAMGSTETRFEGWLSSLDRDKKLSLSGAHSHIFRSLFLLLDGAVLLPQIFNIKQEFSPSELIEVKSLVLKDVMRKLTTPVDCLL